MCVPARLPACAVCAPQTPPAPPPPPPPVTLQGDVRRYEDCERMVGAALSRFGGRLDILVNCAAGNFLSPAEQLSSNGFRTVMEIDALGTFNTSRAAFEALKASGDALIINISMTLHYGATWWQAHASAAKVGWAWVGLEWVGGWAAKGWAAQGGMWLAARAVGGWSQRPVCRPLLLPLVLSTSQDCCCALPHCLQAAVDALTRSLGLEWGHYGIRTAGVAPGPIEGTAGGCRLQPPASF